MSLFIYLLCVSFGSSLFRSFFLSLCIDVGIYVLLSLFLCARVYLIVALFVSLAFMFLSLLVYSSRYVFMYFFRYVLMCLCLRYVCLDCCSSLCLSLFL